MEQAATTNEPPERRPQVNNTQSGNDCQQYNAATINIYQAKQESFREIADWLSPVDPWTNHATARRQREPGTGEWLLNSERYKRWKDGKLRHLWLHGKAGCGKTVICSTVIEDLRTSTDGDSDIRLAIFYFSFSDEHEQSYNDLVRSLVAQSRWEEPALSKLKCSFDKPERRVPATDVLEDILCSSAIDGPSLYVVLDALDECPKENESRHIMLDGLERLIQRAPKLKLLVTSRELEDIRLSIQSLHIDQISLEERVVDADIRKYLSTRMAKDRRLSGLKQDTKALIEREIADKADGMFRYAALQLQEITKLDSYRPSRIQKAIDNLPLSLDETYTRMLNRINENERQDAITLLRWISYARAPLSLVELVDTVIIDCERQEVNVDDRGDLHDVLRILAGLVSIVRDTSDKEEINSEHNCTDEAEIDEDDSVEDGWAILSPDDMSAVPKGSEAELQEGLASTRLRPTTKLRLAHFSVKEYLESTRVGEHVPTFRLDSAQSHHFLTKSCLTYVGHYRDSCDKTLTEQDLEVFPLLGYASRTWYHHAFLHESADVSFETAFLASDLSAWLAVHSPDRAWRSAFESNDRYETGSDLYYASYLGMHRVVKKLIEERDAVDVDAMGGSCGNALQAAAQRGHFEIARVLLDNGANVNATGGKFGSALHAAVEGGHVEVVKLILKNGAHVGRHPTALCNASISGRIEIMKLLLDNGVDVNAEWKYGTSLQGVSELEYVEIMKLLLEEGKGINASANIALWAASAQGHSEIVRLLLDYGTRLDAEVHRNAFSTASNKGYKDIVKLLQESGANHDL